MLKRHNLAPLLLLTCLVSQVKASGSCENKILENLKDSLNGSSSRHYLAKEVLETFFLQANGRNKFNVTKAHRCREKPLTYEKFLDETSLYLSKRNVCGNSYYKISVAALAIYLHLDRYVCGEHFEPYHVYLDQISRLDPLYALSRHIRHNRDISTTKDQQCLNKVKLQRMITVILQEQLHSQHQHSKRRAPHHQTSEAGLSLHHPTPEAGLSLRHPTPEAGIVKDVPSSQSPLFSSKSSLLSSQSSFITPVLLDSETHFATEPPGPNFTNVYHNVTDVHCFLSNNSTRTFCVGLLANHSFSPFHCSKMRGSDVYKCNKHKQNATFKLTNRTLLLAIVSSFSTENIEQIIQFAANMDLVIYSLKILPWVITYQSYKPMKILVNKTFSSSEDGIAADTSHYNESTVNHAQQTTVQKGNNGRKSVHHLNHNYNHVTEKEACAAILVYAVIKDYFLQPRDLPCPSDVLHQLYTYYKPPESQFLSVKDLQSGLQVLLDGKSELNQGPSHSHHKRHLSMEVQHHSYLKKGNHVHISSSHASSLSFKHKPLGQHHSHSSNIDSAHPSPSHGQIQPPPLSDSMQLPPPHGLIHPPPPAHAFEHHGHSSPCSRLFAPIYNERHDHRREKLKKRNWNISDVPDIYYGSSRVQLSLQDLQEVAPALLLLLIEDKGDVPSHKENVTYMQSYGLGTMCVVFLSLASVLGAIFIKITGTKRKAYILSFMLALSVGCLLGDAIFHLLPSAMGVHEEVNLRKLVIPLVTMYGFFLMQLIVSVFHRNHDHSQIFKTEFKKSYDFEVAKNEILELENKARKNEVVLNNILKEDKPMERQESNESQKDLTIEECPSESNVSTNDRDIIPVVWMVILGDCIHNFADGLAIGATFTQSLTEGLSTAIAVLCHEIPHELGDFAILLAAGFTVKKAIMVNLLSSITAFIGLYIGISVGAEFRIWIIAAGGGMFLYISMATMIPELLRLFRNNTCKEMFFALNLGYIFGVVAMLFLAIDEEDLKIS